MKGRLGVHMVRRGRLLAPRLMNKQILHAEWTEMMAKKNNNHNRVESTTKCSLVILAKSMG